MKKQINKNIILHSLKNIQGLFLVPFFSIVFLVIIIFILSDTPLDALYFFFLGPAGNSFFFGNMLNDAIPLIFGALGVIIAMKAGNLNLGGEGQIYLGAFITTVAAVSLSQAGVPGAVIAVFAGSLCAGVLAVFSGFCKAKWNTNEMITTFLVSCAVIPVVNYLVTGPFLDPDTSLISTKKIAENMRLTLILKPSSLSAGIFISFIFVILIYLFLNKTRMGYEFRMAGHNEMFARYGGINIKLNTVISLGFSGFMYGLAGGIAVLGTYYSTIKEFSSGLGWSSLAVALIAFFSPAAVIPCAVFIAWTNTGARIAMQNTGLTYEVAHIVQAVIFLLSTSLFIRNRIKKGKNI